MGPDETPRRVMSKLLVEHAAWRAAQAAVPPDAALMVQQAARMMGALKTPEPRKKLNRRLPQGKARAARRYPTPKGSRLVAALTRRLSLGLPLPAEWQAAQRALAEARQLES